MVSQASVSRSGRYIAAIVTGGPKRRQNLAVIDLKSPDKWKPVAAYSNADVVTARWVNNDRLLFSIADVQRLDNPTRLLGRRYTVDREGKEIKHVWTGGSTNWAPYDGSDDVMVEVATVDGHFEVQSTALYRKYLLSDEDKKLVTPGAPPFTRHWAIDAAGVPRIAVTAREGKSRLYVKPTADAPWTMIQEFGYYDGAEDVPVPFHVDRKNFAYVGVRLKGHDTTELVRYDLASKLQDGQVMLSLDGYDFDGALILGHEGQAIGVRYTTDARGTAWFVPALKEMQKKVDALLPGTINELDCGECENPEVVLVTSWSDRQPEIYRLFDVKAGTLTAFAVSRPWIKAPEMASREMVRFAARDGLSIPVHVTQPNGRTGPAPMVVLVHGGPNIRGGDWQWVDESQFLASRGYVVIEPEYRGGTGFGYKHFKAGMKQWGLAMQDDIADATTWAIKQGYADPKRICIAGASYGGYATFMGLIRYPELYRCGFEWAGVSDLDLMFTSNWNDLSRMYQEYGMPLLVGDPSKDKKQLRETSPVNLADKINQPVLMAHGVEDYRVEIEHGTKMRNAIMGHNKNVEWVQYPDEGHGWTLEADSVDFWNRVERFLDKNLKNAK